MYEVCKKIPFSYGHRLLKNPGRCTRLHGHNAIAEIICQRADLESNDMVVDFEHISDSLKSWIDDTLDHRMILSDQDELVPVLREWKEPFFMMQTDPTAEAIAKVIFDEAIRKRLPVSRVILWETPSSYAVYQK